MMICDNTWHTLNVISIWFPLPLESREFFIESVLNFLSKIHYLPKLINVFNGE